MVQRTVASKRRAHAMLTGAVASRRVYTHTRHVHVRTHTHRPARSRHVAGMIFIYLFIYLFIWNYTFETVAHDVCKYRRIHQNNF